MNAVGGQGVGYVHRGQVRFQWGRGLRRRGFPEPPLASTGGGADANRAIRSLGAISDSVAIISIIATAAVAAIAAIAAITTPA